MADDLLELTGEDMNLIWELSGAKPCSLETKPGDDDNWIERAGGSLPNYICEVAKGVMKSGKTKSAAIAIAISRIKVWAAGGDKVDADTRAKAVKALAQWTALKAKSKAKKVIKASAPDGNEYIILSSVSSYSLDQVRDAWGAYYRKLRREVNSLEGTTSEVEEMPYGYVREVYVDHVIVSFEDTQHAFYRVPYGVDESGLVTFGSPSPVQMVWEDTTSDWRVLARN